MTLFTSALPVSAVLATLLLVSLLLVTPAPAAALNDTALTAAFCQVFQVQDAIEGADSPALAAATAELRKMGVDPAAPDLCLLDERRLALLLMKAALAEYVMGLQDDGDWSVVVADLSTGQLGRRRSFSAVRFAVIETLLLMAIVALGRAVWLRANKL